MSLTPWTADIGCEVEEHRSTLTLPLSCSVKGWGGVPSDCSSPAQPVCGEVNEEGGKGRFTHFWIFLPPLVTLAYLQDQNVKTSDGRKWTLLMRLQTNISDLWQPKNRPIHRSHSWETPTIPRLHRERHPVHGSSFQSRPIGFPLIPCKVSHLRSCVLNLELELEIPSSTSQTGVSFFMYLYVRFK